MPLKSIEAVLIIVSDVLEISGGRLLTKPLEQTGWKGPTIREIADLAGVGTATVDRVLNNRANVREKTRVRVLATLGKLTSEQEWAGDALDIRLFSDSGETFNAALEEAMIEINRITPGVQLRGSFVATSEVEPMAFARRVEREGAEADAAIVVSREHPAMNSAIRKLCAAGTPVICLTTDLPSSRRSAYVGNDQYAAGSVAGLLIGHALPRERSRILIVMSVPFRCQQEREMGFRRVLRSDFPHLRLEERVIADDRPDSTRDQLLEYFASRGAPAAIYNVAGANRGIAQALTAVERGNETVFVGHELTHHSRALLESGIMDYVISHDFAGELTAAIRWLKEHRTGAAGTPSYSQILLHTRYNCGL